MRALSGAFAPDLGPAPHSKVIRLRSLSRKPRAALARVLVEEAATALSVLVLDPRNQFSGLLVPEDRPPLLSAYLRFGMDRPCGFAFAYHRPRNSRGGDQWPLPEALSTLAHGHHLVSFKGSTDAERCNIAADILNAVFDESLRSGETDRPQLIIVIDEAHLFTKRRQLDEVTKEAAARVEAAIDQIVRESRKFGIVLIAITQSMRDFSRDLASVRQMSATKIFLRNADNEIDYAADVLGDGKPLVNLPTGVAVIHNAEWGVKRIRIRPPLSKACEIDDGSLGQLLARPSSQRQVSVGAMSALEILQFHCAAHGPINISHAARLLGITSRRRVLSVIDELEKAGFLRTHSLPEQGKPRMILPI